MTDYDEDGADGGDNARLQAGTLPDDPEADTVPMCAGCGRLIMDTTYFCRFVDDVYVGVYCRACTVRLI
jgi:hypothetical protein